MPRGDIAPLLRKCHCRSVGTGSFVSRLCKGDSCGSGPGTVTGFVGDCVLVRRSARG